MQGICSANALQPPSVPRYRRVFDIWRPGRLPWFCKSKIEIFGAEEMKWSLCDPLHLCTPKGEAAAATLLLGKNSEMQRKRSGRSAILCIFAHRRGERGCCFLRLEKSNQVQRIATSIKNKNLCDSLHL